MCALRPALVGGAGGSGAGAGTGTWWPGLPVCAICVWPGRAAARLSLQLQLQGAAAWRTLAAAARPRVVEPAGRLHHPCSTYLRAARRYVLGRTEVLASAQIGPAWCACLLPVARLTLRGLPAHAASTHTATGGQYLVNRMMRVSFIRKGWAAARFVGAGPCHVARQRVHAVGAAGEGMQESTWGREAKAKSRVQPGSTANSSFSSTRARRSRARIATTAPAAAAYWCWLWRERAHPPCHVHVDNSKQGTRSLDSPRSTDAGQAARGTSTVHGCRGQRAARHPSEQCTLTVKRTAGRGAGCAARHRGAGALAQGPGQTQREGAPSGGALAQGPGQTQREGAPGGGGAAAAAAAAPHAALS